MRYCLLSIACLCATAITSQSQDKSWPTSGIEVETIASNATAVIVAIAKGTPSITRRVPLNINGTMKVGRNIYKERCKVVRTSCTQTFAVVEFLDGERGWTNLTVQYTYLEKNDVFPVPRSDMFPIPKPQLERPIDSGERAILFLGSSNEVLKILSDNETNRNVIAPVLKDIHNRARSK